MNHGKYYAVVLSMLLTWLFHPILLISILSILIYTHPFSSPVFYYIDKQIELFLPIIPHHTVPITPTPTIPMTPDLSLDLYLCKEILKSGKRCRQQPLVNGLCKRHQSSPS